MDHLYRAIVVALVICLGTLPASDAAALAADTPPGPHQVKQQIDQFGVGANLKVELADGKKLKGSVAALGEDGFELRAKSEDPTRYIAYDNVNKVKLAKLKYRAKGTPDAVEARRVVLSLGVGLHVRVKTTAAKEYHGTIQVIDSDSFTMLPDNQTAPFQIAFADVQYVEQNLSRGAKIAIAAGVVVVLVLLYLRWVLE